MQYEHEHTNITKFCMTVFFLFSAIIIYIFMVKKFLRKINWNAHTTLCQYFFFNCLRKNNVFIRKKLKKF